MPNHNTVRSHIVAAVSANHPARRSNPGASPGIAERDPGQIQADERQLRLHQRDVMIPMRDGVKLHTVILIPKGAQRRADSPDPDAL